MGHVPRTQSGSSRQTPSSSESASSSSVRSSLIDGEDVSRREPGSGSAWKRGTTLQVSGVRRTIRLFAQQTLLAWVCLLVTAVGCADESSAKSLRAQQRSVAGTVPAEFSFEETAAILAPLEILLEPLQEQDRHALLTPSDFDKLLQGRMDRNPTWRVLSVHVAMVTMPNAKFDLYGLPMYVVEITGPETGNCFDLYYATDGSYWGLVVLPSHA
jgi:hypothetical protein